MAYVPLKSKHKWKIRDLIYPAENKERDSFLLLNAFTLENL